MPTTLRDIAEACAMDVSTVSRALRDDPRVSNVTRQRIKKLAGDMGYRPNPAARSLVGASTRTVWFVMPNIRNPLEQQPAETASQCLAEAGYDMLVMLYQNDSDRYLHCLTRLGQGITDGAIVIPGPVGIGEDKLAELAGGKFPLVFLDRHPEGAPHLTVTSDNLQGAREIVARALDQGVEMFVLLMQEDRNSVETRRIRGALEVLGERGVPFVFGDKLAESGLPGRAAGVGLLASSQVTARGAMEEYARLFSGRRIVAAVFDAWEGDPFPAVTAIVCEQDFAAMAREAVRRVLGMIRGKVMRPEIHMVPPLAVHEIHTRVL